MTSPKPRHSKEHWIKLIEGKQDSPLTIDEYCKHNQITVSSFYTWRAKLKKQIATAKPSTPNSTTGDWLPINLSASPPVKPSWDIELDLPGGITLRVKSA
jgi:hypothetical protein